MSDTAAPQIVTIIDYGSGNLRSAAKAFEHVIAQNNLNFEVRVSAQARDVECASHIVLPGQGAFGDCMAGLKSVPNMIEALERTVLENKKPFLGICVGMQLLATEGHEYGIHKGLGWIEGQVVPIEPQEKTLKIPHMGWNVCEFPEDLCHPVLRNKTESDKKNEIHYYFVHSFMFESKGKENILGTVQYGGEVTAIVGRANIIGTQFHPEKSQEAGLELLHDFLQWDGTLNEIFQGSL